MSHGFTKTGLATAPAQGFAHGHISGLTMSNNGAAPSNALDIAVGACTADGGDVTEPPVWITLGSGITKYITSNWAAGDGNGGFPSGLTKAADTTYHVFLILDEATGTVDGGFDTSLTATNLLADATSYTQYRRIGSVVTGSGAGIRAFTQIGDQFWWHNPNEEISDNTATTTAFTPALTVPTGIEVIAKIHFLLDETGSGGGYVLVTPTFVADRAPATQTDNYWIRISATGEFASVHIEVPTDTSGQIRWRRNSNTFRVRGSCYAYIDRRGGSGTGGVTFTDNSTTNNTYTGTFLRNYIDGLQIMPHFAGDSNHDIYIEPGTCADSTNAEVIDLTARTRKRIDGAWAAGDGNGGFPSGITLSADTWYHVFVIYDDVGDTVDGGFDTSITAVNLLADATDYTYYRRIGSVLTDGNSNLVQFQQFGDYFAWLNTTTVGEEFNNGSPSTTNTTTLTVPTGLDYGIVAHCHFLGDYLSSAFVASVWPKANVDHTLGNPVNQHTVRLNSAAVFNHTEVIVPVGSDAQIEYGADTTDARVRLAVRGYWDLRGKDGNTFA